MRSPLRLFPHKRWLQTTHRDISSARWVEVTHPFHPFRGQSFKMVRQRRLSGVDSVELKGPGLCNVTVPLEWTSLAVPSAYANEESLCCVAPFEKLDELAQFLAGLDEESRGTEKE